MEDDTDLRALLLESLRAAGYDTFAVADGIEALRTIVEDPPDLVLTDVLMPGGFEVRADDYLVKSPDGEVRARAAVALDRAGLEERMLSGE